MFLFIESFDCRFVASFEIVCFIHHLLDAFEDSLLASNRQIGLIPLKNQSLILYSKFDNETGFNYVEPPNATVIPESVAGLVDSFDGPFSIPYSSYRTSSIAPLGHFQMSPKINLPSFTLSFYLRVVGNETDGIYREWHDPGYRFTLSAVNLDLEFHTHHISSDWPANSGTVFSVTFPNVFIANDWKFVALTYDGTNKNLK